MPESASQHRLTACCRPIGACAQQRGAEHMAVLIVPGVQVQARFDILPPLPAASGIVGIAGIVDRVPADGGLVGVTRATELRELLGPGTEASMPEAVHA